MNATNPKVFISYSWTSSDRVIELATRLMDDGVEVVLDKWELREGQDKYAFMEQSVVDPAINKVLLICDKAYAEKADARQGGVGDETMVISPEVYQKANETKYIPVIFERDEKGESYAPKYLKSRIYIDLCKDNPDYAKEYEKLLRNLWEKPEHSKPALGKMPEYLNEETVSFSGVRNKLKKLQASDGKNKINFVVKQFTDEFIQSLIALAPLKDADFDKKLLIQIDNSKPLRDIYLASLEALIMNGVDTGDIIAGFFEQLYNDTYVVEGCSYSESDFEFQRFAIWELFICSTVMLLHYEKYQELRSLLHRTYFLRGSPASGNEYPKTFMQFCPGHDYIETVLKPKSENPRRYTMSGDILVKRERPPIITKDSLVNADIVLYQLSCVYDFSEDLHHWSWFPILYVYFENLHKQAFWSKTVSRQYCQKLFPLFGIKDITQLKAMFEKCKHNREMCYPSCFRYAPSIQQSIELDKIGSMP